MAQRPSQKLTWEARTELTGLSPLQREELVRKLVKAGWSERQIAKWLGIAASTAHYAVAAVKGRPRQSRRVMMCEGCWEDFPASELVGGLCAECR
jgi:DNA-directed RNA polymerase specialized sigma24 family protein